VKPWAQTWASVRRLFAPRSASRRQSSQAWQRWLQADKHPATELLRNVLENIPVGIWVVDRDLRFVLWNAALEEITGVPRDQVLGQHILERFPSTSAHGLDQFYVRMLRTGEPLRLDRFPFHDPTLRRPDYILDIKVKPLRDPKGAIAGLVAMVHDVTETTHALAALQRRDAILEAMGFAAERLLRAKVWDETIPEVLARLGQATGASRIQILENQLSSEGVVLTSRRHIWRAEGAASSHIAEPVIPARLWEEPLLRRWREALSRGEAIYGLAADLPPAEGEALQRAGILSVALVPIMVQDAWWGTLGLGICASPHPWSLTEIEALKAVANLLGAAIQRSQMERDLRESEERYRVLFENLGDAFILVDAELRLVEFRDSSSLSFGLEREKVIGQPIAEALAGLRLPGADLASVITQVLRTGRTRRFDGARYLAPHLARRQAPHFDVVIYPIRARGAQHVVLLCRDISETRRLEAQLARARRLEALGRLASEIAHDFRNLLAVIQTASELLLSRCQEIAPAHQWLEAITQSVIEGREIIQQLLTFSRGEEVQLEILPLNMLVREAEVMLKRLLGESVALELALAEEDLFFWGDRGQVHRILLNLASNAREAMPQGGRCTIETRLTHLDREAAQLLGLAAGDYALLVVSDTGIGLSEEAREHLFEPFYTTKKLHRGSGLGLATVYGIMQQHRGQITVESEPGRGTSFFLYFPALLPEQEEVEGPSA